MPQSKHRSLKNICNTSNTLCSFGYHVLLLFVGPRADLITLHSDLLPEKTKSYLTARAAAQPFHQLPDELPEIVNLYRLFLYTGTIFSIGNNDKDEFDGAEHNNGASMDAERTKLMECYLLGTHLHDERFRNAAINALVEKVEKEEEYPTGLASDVYRHTESGDRLRKLIVDFHVWKGQGELFVPSSLGVPLTSFQESGCVSRTRTLMDRRNSSRTLRLRVRKPGIW